MIDWWKCSRFTSVCLCTSPLPYYRFDLRSFREGQSDTHLSRSRSSSSRTGSRSSYIHRPGTGRTRRCSTPAGRTRSVRPGRSRPAALEYIYHSMVQWRTGTPFSACRWCRRSTGPSCRSRCCCRSRSPRPLRWCRCRSSSGWFRRSERWCEKNRNFLFNDSGNDFIAARPNVCNHSLHYSFKGMPLNFSLNFRQRGT